MEFYLTNPLGTRVNLKELPERLQFDLRLQVSLRSNAINIMKHYEAKEKFQEYIQEREEKIRILLNLTENPLIFDGESQIFP